MTHEEIYKRAMLMAEHLSKMLDAQGADYYEGLSIFGYASALLLHLVAQGKGSDPVEETERFCNYLMQIVPTFKEREQTDNQLS